MNMEGVEVEMEAGTTMRAEVIAAMESESDANFKAAEETAEAMVNDYLAWHVRWPRRRKG